MTGFPEHFNFTRDIFDAWAARQPEQPALWWINHDGSEERRQTFGEMRESSLRAARMFAAAGLSRGDTVLVMLPRVPEWWIAMLGLIRMGAVPVPCTPLLTRHDLEYRLQAACIRAVITDASGTAKLAGFSGPRWQTDDACTGWKSFAASLAASPAEFTDSPIPSDDPGLIYFTSATTGHPKMVLHTQVSYGLGHRVTGRDWLALRSEDLHWNTADLGWAKAAWSSFFGPWHQGACLFAHDSPRKFDASQAMDILGHFPITTLCAPPTALRMMVTKDIGKRTFPHLRHTVTAGEPLNTGVLNSWRDATGLTIHEGYGQSETTILLGNFVGNGHPVVPGSMGRVAPGVPLHLIDEEFEPVPAGEEGEIALALTPHRPLGLFREYWLDPEQTARHFSGGWYLTGDRAIRDRDGYFHFIGRKDDVIKSSGYRIGPFEVESALVEHPAVADAAVVGKPDELRGQIVKAFVVLRDGTMADDTTRRELQAYCKSLVAPYKYPREIEFVDDLPKTISGKTRRFELRMRAGNPVGA